MSKLEKIEWTNIWYTDTRLENKILLLGDSITQGYHCYVDEAFENKYCVGTHTTSKAVDNIYLIKEIELMINQYGKNNFKAVHVNNGIHGSHLSDSEYAKFFDMYIYQLKEMLPDSKFILALSTPITTPEKGFRYSPANDQIIRRNAIVTETAKRYGMTAEDLYSVVDGIDEIRAGDGFHYNSDGYEKLGRTVISTIKSVL